MKYEDFCSLVEVIERRALALLEKKGHDYATDEDLLSNFKRISQVATALLHKEVSPLDICTILLVLKLDRLSNLQNKTPTNESIVDTEIDLTNYTRLLIALRHETELEAIKSMLLKEQLEG